MLLFCYQYQQTSEHRKAVYTRKIRSLEAIMLVRGQMESETPVHFDERVHQNVKLITDERLKFRMTQSKVSVDIINASNWP